MGSPEKGDDTSRPGGQAGQQLQQPAEGAQPVDAELDAEVESPESELGPGWEPA